MFAQRFFRSVCLTALLVSGFLGTGCATNGRRILLKEYGASIPASANASLKGSTICLKNFTAAPDLVSLELKTNPEEPASFKYMDRTREQDKLWDAEMKALRKQTSETDWRKIGNLRNGFGMVLSHVYALNDPAVWLTESLKMDLEAQGAKVVDASQAGSADVVVSGVLQLCRTDIYMIINGSIVVDLEVQPKGGAPHQLQVHTHGATTAAIASEGEFFHALRDARQKFSLITTREIAQALKPK